MEAPLHVWSWLLILVPLVTAKQGYIFTSPRALICNETVNTVLTLYDVAETGIVKASLVLRGYNYTKTLVEVSENVDKPSPSSGQMFKLAIPVPPSDNRGSVYINVYGNLGSYVFEKNASVTINCRKNTLLIQTDKPIYKPGQMVSTRLMSLDSQYRSLANQTFDAWINTPSGIRVAQWLRNSTDKGMAQFQMQLPEVCSFGTWNIYVNCSGNYDNLQSQSFEVEEYVLPKFEVEIIPPPYVLSSATNMTWKICARYTYGKMVKGNISLEASFESYGYWDREKYPKFTHEDWIDGCIDFPVQEKDMGWIDKYSYRSRALQLFAKVIEDGTNVERNSTKSIYLTKDPVKLSFKNQDNSDLYFKPGMPCSAQVAISNPDDTPRPNDTVQICVLPSTQMLKPNHHRTDTYLSCRNFTADKNGIVNFTVPAFEGNVVNLKIQADAANFPTLRYHDNNIMYNQPSNVLMLKPWYSPSKRYIQIVPLTQEAACDSVQYFTVYMNGAEGEIFDLSYQMISRDGLKSHESVRYEYSKIKGNLPMDDTFVAKPMGIQDNPDTQSVVGIVSLPVKVTSEMAPSANLLVYYVKNDGEIVADSVSFKVKKCLRNKVGIEFSTITELPGRNVSMKVTASPKSLCGIGVVDKSVSLLGSSTAMTQERVLDILSSGPSYMDGYFYHDNTCIPQETPGPASFVRRRRRNVILPPYLIKSGYADSLDAFQNGRMIFFSDLSLVTKPCISDSGPFYPSYPIEPYAMNGRTMEEEDFISSPAMGVMKMAIDRAGPESSYSEPEVTVRDYFPESWLWEINFMNEHGETTLYRQLPQTITQWDASAVCMHPEDGLGASPKANITTFQPFFVSATLPYSVIRGEIAPIFITVFNYLQDCLPVTLKVDKSDSYTLVHGPSKQDLCICGGNSVTKEYWFNATKLGQVNVTSRAFTNYSSNVCGTRAVGNSSASDGATNPILVESEGFPHRAAFSSFVCPKYSNGTFRVDYSLAIPENSVKDSAQGHCLVTGDLMGPALKNIKDLINMPMGCGEQNMLNFVPDIYIAHYLTETGKMDENTKNTLYNYISNGYNRELTYRHYDASYSAFGESDDSGSIWLTAFVVKSFKGASKFIYVDQSHIASSVSWIMANQHVNGCFPLIGEVHHTAMQGGSGSNLGSRATMTAYILIAILESQAVDNTTTVKKALSCLHEEKNPTIYTLSLMTYAYCLANDSEAPSHLDTLMKQRKSKGDGDYWDDDSTNSAAIQVETASYALLSLMTCQGSNNMERALPVVRWLSTCRNPTGGFYSTQDTVIALQALAKYSTHIDKNKINIDATISEEGEEKKVFHVDEDNKILVQSSKLHKIPATVSVEGKGTGCSLVQCNMFYNVMTPPDFNTLHHNISVVRGIEKSCKKASIISCMSYNYQNKFSNMVVMELRMPSGYEPDMSSITSLKRDRKLYLKRADYDKNTLAIYFNKVAPTKKCFNFKIEMMYEIQNLQPTTVRLFEYYHPEHQISQALNLEGNCTIV